MNPPESTEEKISEACAALTERLVPIMTDFAKRTISPKPNTWGMMLANLRTVIEFAEEQIGPATGGGNDAWRITATDKPMPCEEVIVSIDGVVRIAWMDHNNCWFETDLRFCLTPDAWLPLPPPYEKEVAK